MKKFFPLFVLFCFSFSAGLLFSACGDKNAYITVENASESMVGMNIKHNEEVLNAETDGRYKLEKGVNLRVDIFAKEFGVDLSDLKINIDGNKKSVILNSKYSYFPEDETLDYGYFLLTDVKENLTISISGAKRVETTFKFEGLNLEDEQVVEKLKLASIDFNSTNEFQNLYKLLNSEDTYKKTFDNASGLENKYSTFKIKFEGISPFEIINSYPFSIKLGQTEKPISQMILSDDCYIVDLGKLGLVNECTIVVDFSNLNFENYNIVLPQDSLTFTSSVDKSRVNFMEEANLTINKLMTNEKADYSQMKAYVNGKPLELVSETKTENVYKIPSKITPKMLNGGSAYEIVIEDIQYVKNVYTLSYNSAFTNLDFIQTRFCALDDQNNDIGAIGYAPNGLQITLEGQRNAFSWAYQYDETLGGYHSAYDLIDYSVTINGEKEKAIKLKDYLQNKTTYFETIVDGKYIFKAFFNDNSKTFDRFVIEFQTESDMQFEFADFVKKTKQINIGFDITDQRLFGVEYLVETDVEKEAEWTNLAQNIPSLVLVKSGDVVVFRLKSMKETIGDFEFAVLNSLAVGSTKQAIRYVKDGYNYLELRFVVSDFQFEKADFTLVNAGV